jgi:hypothetical protein
MKQNLFIRPPVIEINSFISCRCIAQKKAGLPNISDISATRLSSGDPVGFPPHPRGWFSIIVYRLLLPLGVSDAVLFLPKKRPRVNQK